MVKKIFLLLILVLSIKGYGQTYTVKVSYNQNSETCHGSVEWWLYGDSNEIGSGNEPLGDFITNYIYPEVRLYNSFELKLANACTPPQGSTDLYCRGTIKKSIQASQLVKNGRTYLKGCAADVEITEFIPNNLIITNKKGSSICSGDQLDLFGSFGFPDVAYHWQYSINNQITWVDVPSSIGSNPNTNDTPQTAFSINDLLGSTSEQYFGKTIHFRLGYGQNRPFSNVIPITYSPCGPIINSFAIEKPDCSGGKIKKIDVFFKDDLKAGETLNSIYLRKMEYKGIENDNPPLFRNTSDIVYRNKKHSIPIIDPFKLENGMHYQIIYQTFLNGQPRGVLYSPVQQYIDPTVVTCSIKVPENILCSDGTTSIEITANGGTGSYYFYKDNIKLEGSLYPKVKDGKYYINNLIGEPAGKAYKILVTDTNGCYE
jgi:hypothetical protein